MSSRESEYEIFKCSEYEKFKQTKNDELCEKLVINEQYLKDKVKIEIKDDYIKNIKSDESSDEVFSDEKSHEIDEEVIVLQNNYNKIASHIIKRDRQFEVDSKLPTVVKDIKPTKTKTKSSESDVSSLKDLKTDSEKTKKTKKISITPNDDSQTKMCNDVADLIILGIKREIKCDNTLPPNIKIISTPKTDITIPARYKCKTCGTNRVFLGDQHAQRLFDVTENCCKNLKSMAQRGLGFLSLSETCGRFMNGAKDNLSWGVYLQMWHSTRHYYCESIYTDFKNCFNYKDGEFSISPIQKLKACNYVPVTYLTTYNNFHQIRNVANCSQK